MQVLKEMQQAGGQAMDQKAVLKVAFSGVSGGSLERPAGRKAMPDTGTGTADEVFGKASPLAWLHKVLVLSEPPSCVSAARTSPAPLLISTKKPGSHRRGLSRGKNKGKGHQKPHEPSENMRQMLKELLQAGQEKDKKAVRKAAFPRGSSGSMAASAAGREAMPGTGPGDWDRDMDSMLVFVDESLKTSADSRANPVGESDLASQPTFRNEPLGDAEGVSAGRTFPGPLVDVARRPSSRHRALLRMENKPRGDRKSLEASKHMEKMPSDLERRHDAAGPTTHADNIWESTRRVFCWGTPCLKKLMAIVAGAALCLMMCYAAIWYCWKRKWLSCASPEDQPTNTGNDNLIVYPSSSLLPLFALPWLHHHHESIPKPTPPQRDPLPLSPLVLFPGQE
ncbi:uncharacterized protein LOC135307302 isoform X1 [Passer domesticus]|uniref:uncharacterized protein LOC135307302 isoform X1 n=1 Tax=Passer domesticus TaxID=48849 RepID=UPI0030FE765C